MMIPLSVLDLMPIRDGGSAAEAFAQGLDLARHAEAWGYRRYWIAEHHNIPGVASAATAVAIGHIAGGTKTIRVGAGGIMLPNHAPLVVAEQFGTLETLHPGRIDLGLGRAPGSDQETARALRRTLAGDPDGFPRDVIELIDYFRDPGDGPGVHAVPGAGLDIPVWILGSSQFGAYLAAALGLPYAFASHFAPAELDAALAVYRQRFTPSDRRRAPYAMPGVTIVAADTDEEARFYFSSLQQAFINLRLNRPGRLPPPVDGFAESLPPAYRAVLDATLSCAIVGAPDTVRRGIAAFRARTAADELIVTAQIYDHAARLRSYELLAEIAGLDGSSAPVPADRLEPALA